MGRVMRLRTPWLGQLGQRRPPFHNHCAKRMAPLKISDCAIKVVRRTRNWEHYCCWRPRPNLSCFEALPL